MSAVLFPLDVRLSTWLALGAFAGLAIVRPHRHALLACAAWLFGFEAAYQLSMLMVARSAPAWRWAPLVICLVAALVLLRADKLRVRPSALVMAGVGMIWFAWLASGFAVNAHGTTDLNVPAEVLNELAKSLWALAYLWPLRRITPDGIGAVERG